MSAPLELSKADTRERKRLLGFMTRPGPRFGLAMGLFADARHAAAVREQLVSMSAEQGQRVGVLEFGFEDEERDLVEAMREAGAADIDVLFVLNLELLVVDAAGVLRHSSAVANLNQRRDELPQLLDVRVVFWIPQAADGPLHEVALDLCRMMLTTAEFSGELALGELELEREERLPAWMQPAPPEEHAALLGQLENLERVLRGGRGRQLGSLAQSAGELEVRLGQLERGRSRLREAAGLYGSDGYSEEAARAAGRAAEISLALGQLEAADEDLQLGYRLVSEELPAQAKEEAERADEDASELDELDDDDDLALEAVASSSSSSAPAKRRQDAFVELGASEQGAVEEMIALGDVLADLDDDAPMEAPALKPAPAPPPAPPSAAPRPPPVLAHPPAAEAAPSSFAAPGSPPPASFARPKSLPASAPRPARAPAASPPPQPAVPVAEPPRAESREPRPDSSDPARARRGSGPRAKSWRDSRPSQAISELTVTTALVSARQGKLETSRAQLERALEGFGAAEDHVNCARVYGHLAQLSEDEGDYARALELRREQQLPAYLLAKDEQGAARARVKIAELLARTGEVHASVQLIREVLPALAPFEPDATPQREAVATLAAVLEAAGQPQVAAQLRHQYGDEEPEASDPELPPPPPPPPPPPSDPRHGSSSSSSNTWTEEPLDHRRAVLLLAVVIVAALLLLASL